MNIHTSVTQQQVMLEMSKHAAARIRQRGLTERDINLIRGSGESVDDGFLMTNRAIDLRVQALRREITRIEKLRGVAVIESADKVITVYRADRKRVRRLIAGEFIQR